MVVSQHNLSIIRLEVDISVSLVIEEILKMSFSDDQRLFVVSLIYVGKVFQPLGDDFLSIALEGLWRVFDGRQLKRREEPGDYLASIHGTNYVLGEYK